LRDRVAEVRSWNDVKLLKVKVDRLQRWYRPGLFCIGDAAHAMSPVGGVGINLAIQDAVAAANIIGKTTPRRHTPQLPSRENTEAPRVRGQDHPARASRNPQPDRRQMESDSTFIQDPECCQLSSWRAEVLDSVKRTAHVRIVRAAFLLLWAMKKVDNQANPPGF
jgi:hypothetical protein